MRGCARAATAVASAEKLRMVEESLAGEASVAKIAHHDIHPNLLRLLRGRCAREF